MPISISGNQSTGQKHYLKEKKKKTHQTSISGCSSFRWTLLFMHESLARKDRRRPPPVFLW